MIDRILDRPWLLLALLLTPLVVLAVVCELHWRAEIRRCRAHGGSWVVVGHHYQAPTYIKSGPALVPVGGGDVADWGCR